MFTLSERLYRYVKTEVSCGGAKAADVSAQPQTIILVGLDGAGKSTVLAGLEGGRSCCSIYHIHSWDGPPEWNIRNELIALNHRYLEPLDDVQTTHGFSSGYGKVGPTQFRVFDVGGGRRIRDIWHRYFAEVTAVVYVVDSADTSRFEESLEVFNKTVSHPYVKKKPVLILVGGAPG